MRIRLNCKLADWMDGIDLSHCTVGDVIDLAEHEARMIVAERWAVFARRAADRMGAGSDELLASAFAEGRRLSGDRRRSSRVNDVYQRLRDKCEEIDHERRRLRRRSTDAGCSEITAA